MNTSKEQRPVLLRPGAWHSTLEVQPFARLLRDVGFHLVVPALQDYNIVAADAGKTASAPNFRSWITDACTEIDWLGKSYGELSICGVSLGATLALAVAAESSDKLCWFSLISTMLFFDCWNVSRWHYPLSWLLYTPLGCWLARRESPPLRVQNKYIRSWIETDYIRGTWTAGKASTVSAARLKEMDRLIRHVKRSLGRVHTPTLTIRSRKDDRASLANIDYVRSHIGVEHYRELVVDDSYHMIMLDNDQQLAAAKTAQFYKIAVQWWAEDLREGWSWATSPNARREVARRGRSACP